MRFLLACLLFVAVLTSFVLANVWANDPMTLPPPPPLPVLSDVVPVVPVHTPTPDISSSRDLIPPVGLVTRPTTLAGQLPSETLPMLRLTPDKIEVVRLDADGVNVIVGNSAHLLAVMETSRQILLVPRAPGATHFQVLDANGNTVMERSVIVAAPKQDYIRVRRACANKDNGECKEYSVFYCPDMCHAVNVTQTAVAGSGAKVDVPAEAASNGGSGNNVEMINDQPVSPDAPANVGATTGQMLMTP